MGHMPAIPESTRDSITWRLILHAEKNWPQLGKVQVTCRGAFAYAAGILPGGEILPLFRLRYGGSAHSFGFAIYSHASERYETPSSSPAAPPEPRRKHSTPPAPSTSPASDMNPTPNPQRIYGANHLAGVPVRGCSRRSAGEGGVEGAAVADHPGRGASAPGHGP